LLVRTSGPALRHLDRRHHRRRLLRLRSPEHVSVAL